MNTLAKHSDLQEEVENVYALLQRSDYRSITLTSSMESEGVSATAQALVNRLMLAGHSTLLVDLNIYSPSTQNPMGLGLEKEFSATELSAPGILTSKHSDMAFLGVRAEPSKASLNLLRQPSYMKQQLQQWLDEFEYVVVDAPPLLGPQSHGLPAELLASVSDTCLLVVLTCRTSDQNVSEAVRKLRSVDANILGCIMNDRNNPSLQQELLREIDRLPKCFSLLKNWIMRKVQSSQYLSMEV